MFLSGKKLRKLRRRLGLIGMVVAGTIAVYWSSNLAWASNQSHVVHLPQELPEVVTRVKPGLEDWLPGLQPVELQDLLANSELHAQEENCNVAGFYANSAPDLELKGSGWTYSSNEGLMREKSYFQVSDPKKFGYRGDAPVWGLMTAQSLAANLPDGLKLSQNVQALESRLWPEQQRGELVLHLLKCPDIADDKALSLEQSWRHLPSALLMGCLRKEIAAAILDNRGRLSNSAEHWIGFALPLQLDASQWNSLWNRVQHSRIPSALWIDFACSAVSPGSSLALTTDQQGSLFTLAMDNSSGSATLPGDGQSLGAGRFQWEGKRVEWVANIAQGQVIFSYHWSEAPLETNTAIIPTMGPEVETLYHSQSNVIAGR